MNVRDGNGFTLFKFLSLNVVKNLILMFSSKVALSVFYPAQLIVDGQTHGGETVTIHVYMFTQGHSKMCCCLLFHSV